MNILYHHNFKNLFINHIKNNLTVIRTAIFSTRCFCFYFSYFSNFFGSIMQWKITPKWEIKTKVFQKKYSQANKDRLQERLQEYYRNLSEAEKILKNTLTLQINFF